MSRVEEFTNALASHSQKQDQLNQIAQSVSPSAHVGFGDCFDEDGKETYGFHLYSLDAEHRMQDLDEETAKIINAKIDEATDVGPLPRKPNGRYIFEALTAGLNLDI